MNKSIAGELRGFTLIELAVVIAIVALLLGALLVPLATQVQGRNIKETQRSLKEIKEALLGYAVTQGRLPCPDTDRDGLEDCAVANPWDVLEGFLPWQDLTVVGRRPHLYTMGPGRDDGDELLGDFDLWLGLRGACSVRMLGRTLEFREGRAILIPPGVTVGQFTGPGGLAAQ